MRRKNGNATAGRGWVVPILLALFVIGGAARPHAQSGSAMPSGTELMTPMRDGVNLSTVYYLPQGTGPWPSILVRTPYDKLSPLLGGGPFMKFMQNGYALVVQDTRGRFKSEGTQEPFLTDADDGYDTVEWIAKQPWSDGKVGTIGLSAMGITQLQMAIAQPPHLKCMYVGVGAMSLFGGSVYEGGELRKELAIKWLASNKFPPDALMQFLEHPTFDAFWKKVDTAYNISKFNVPAVHFGGWFDIFQQGTIKGFELAQAQGGPNARGKQKLIVGPWVHAGMISARQGELRFPSNSVYMLDFRDQLQWFDDCVEGKDTGVFNEPAVRYYTMGDVNEKSPYWNIWQTGDTWPPANTPTRYYLHADGTLSTVKPTGAGDSRKYKYDPKNPVPTIGGGNLHIKSGPMDQQAAEGRKDVLLFTSEALKEPVKVSGPLSAVLYVSTSACDTDFTVKLTDVYPTGQSILLLDGIQRGMFRNSLEKPEPMKPGQVYEMRVNLWDTSYVFNKGHKIRIAVSSSNFPRFSANRNACDAKLDKTAMLKDYDLVKRNKWVPVIEGQKYVVAQNTLYLGRDRASYVSLPLAPLTAK